LHAPSGQVKQQSKLEAGSRLRQDGIVWVSGDETQQFEKAVLVEDQGPFRIATIYHRAILPAVSQQDWSL
jgi:hypothetical protein